MSMRYKVNCKSCQMSKTDPKLRKRIRYAAYKREHGDETLADIALERGLSVPQIYNHVKKHMSDAQESYNAAKDTKIAKQREVFKANVAKELELSVDVDVLDSIEGRPESVVALDDYISQAKLLIDKGLLKINATSFLQAVKIRTDWSSKQQTNKTEFMKAIYAMSSGDKKEMHGTKSTGINTEEDAGSSHTGEEEPKTVYGAITGADTP